MKFLDIIIPVYNANEFLDKCINSVLSQSFLDYRIILIDDGSTDGSGEKCDFYKNKYPNIIVIHKKNGGASSARNAALKIAKSKYVMFLDSDDYIFSEALSKAYLIVQKYNFPDFIIFNSRIENNKKSVERYKIGTIKDGIISKENYYKLILKDFIYVTPWGKLFNRKLFDNIGFKENKINEDEFIIHRLVDACNTEIISSSNLFYNYQIYRNDSVSNRNDLQKHMFDSVEAFVERSCYFKKKGYKSLALKNFLIAIELFYKNKRQINVKNKSKPNLANKYLCSNYYCNKKICLYFLYFLYILKKIKKRFFK